MPRAMIWDSASSTEYPNVCVFAQKKKLVIMSAHDSIIAARVKQTRDVNRKRQEIAFGENDLVYLSVKNITFPKGLARKLIPKYIGPYKIIKDFKNQSYKIDLPTHLKQRGVHDVFHASLLRIHHPNDDRLFPGQMDTQIGENFTSSNKWAVEAIQSHNGTAENAVFKVLWKSGDVTWVPYLQIKHIPAMEEYLKLLNVDNIAKLPKGKEILPQDDLQISLGCMSLDQEIETIDNLSETNFTHKKQDINQLFLQNSTFLFLPHIHLSIDNFHFAIIMPSLPCIQHPRFTRRSKTEYIISNPDG